MERLIPVLFLHPVAAAGAPAKTEAARDTIIAPRGPLLRLASLGPHQQRLPGRKQVDWTGAGRVDPTPTSISEALSVSARERRPRSQTQQIRFLDEIRNNVLYKEEEVD